MDLAKQYAEQAQRWHDTDHGTARGKPIKGDKFKQPRDDDVPKYVPADFRKCPLCDPCVRGSQAPHTNPFWFRVLAWEMDD